MRLPIVRRQEATMAEQRRSPGRLSRPPGKSPAERSAEFDAKQAQLKAEAAARREAAAEKAAAEEKKRAKKKS
jgi:hypothetical protein